MTTDEAIAAVIVAAMLAAIVAGIVRMTLIKRRLARWTSEEIADGLPDAAWMPAGRRKPDRGTDAEADGGGSDGGSD